MSYYMEAFNTQYPEKREYFQIVENGDARRFTVSHILLTARRIRSA